ncbi:hypothetical protein Rhal01_03740 [Rubritalea halochordaticola]|uniref:Uncharacterized protein n=1 Tax=Rubritalea halochordaticola TaxID=714537 RepID=A0ABP9V6M2_9BACT
MHPKINPDHQLEAMRISTIQQIKGLQICSWLLIAGMVFALIILTFIDRHILWFFIGIILYVLRHLARTQARSLEYQWLFAEKQLKETLEAPPKNSETQSKKLCLKSLQASSSATSA